MASNEAAVKDIRVSYLEMHAPIVRDLAPPRDDLLVLHAVQPTMAYYRFLYHTVGKDYNWYSRGQLSDAELIAILDNPLNEVHVLHANGVPAGYAELDRRDSENIELVQFGLMPGFIGQGLGKWFLNWTVQKAWSYHPRRLWLHTCTEDHPAALPNYLKAGFKIYREEMTRR